MRPSLILPFVAAVALAGAPAFGDTDPDAQIKFRKSVMSAVGGSASAIAAVLKGEVAAPDSLPVLTATLASASDPVLTVAAFRPDTTDQGFEKTTATPRVWTDWAEFEKGLMALNETARAAAAKGADVTMADMQEVFKTCKACHDDFREK